VLVLERVTTITSKVGEVTREITFVNGLPLNQSNEDLLVNVLQCYESGPDGKLKKKFSSSPFRSPRRLSRVRFILAQGAALPWADIAAGA
jgi:hypothetical protein